MKEEKIALLSGRATLYLSEKIAEKLKIDLIGVDVVDFSDGESRPQITKSIRGKDVFIIQSTFQPTDNLFELLMIIDAAKRASAKTITVVIPYYGFARQDRKDKPRVPITAKLIADLLVAVGISRLITMDLHADQIQAFFDIPVDNLFAATLFVKDIISLNMENITIVSPDEGATKRARKYVNFLNQDLIKKGLEPSVSLALCYKSRKKANQIEEMELLGIVKDRNVIIIDDMIDTAGTIIKAAQITKDAGAISVRTYSSHPVCSGESNSNIEEATHITEIIVTDTIPIENLSKKIRVVSTAGLFAEVIKRVKKNKSVTSLFSSFI